MPNQWSREPKRTIPRVVRLTEDEDRRARAKAARMSETLGRKVTVCEVLRMNVET